jgi:hypothetical protein
MPGMEEVLSVSDGYDAFDFEFHAPVGVVKTVTLEPVAPATITDAKISSVFYSRDWRDWIRPKSLPVDPRGTSFSFSVGGGTHRLIVSVESPTPGDQDVQLYMGTVQMALLKIRNHSGRTGGLMTGIPVDRRLNTTGNIRY